MVSSAISNRRLPPYSNLQRSGRKVRRTIGGKPASSNVDSFPPLSGPRLHSFLLKAAFWSRPIFSLAALNRCVSLSSASMLSSSRVNLDFRGSVTRSFSSAWPTESLVVSAILILHSLMPCYCHLSRAASVATGGLHPQRPLQTRLTPLARDYKREFNTTGGKRFLHPTPRICGLDVWWFWLRRHHQLASSRHRTHRRFAPSSRPADEPARATWLAPTSQRLRQNPRQRSS
jgi:hypothetical protein